MIFQKGKVELPELMVMFTVMVMFPGRFGAIVMRRMTNPFVSINIGDIEEWGRLCLVKLLRVRHSQCLVCTRARASILPIEYRLLSAGVVPVVPAFRSNDVRHVSVGEYH